MERRLAALPSDAPSVITEDGLAAFKLNGAGGSVTSVAAEGQPFQSALEIRTISKPAKPYAATDRADDGRDQKGRCAARDFLGARRGAFRGGG